MAALGAAAAVLLGGAGSWAWSRHQGAIEAVALAERANEQDDERHRRELFDHCVEQVAEWDSGQRATLWQSFGSDAEQIVERCRPVVAGSPPQ